MNSSLTVKILALVDSSHSEGKKGDASHGARKTEGTASFPELDAWARMTLVFASQSRAHIDTYTRTCGL